MTNLEKLELLRDLNNFLLEDNESYIDNAIQKIYESLVTGIDGLENKKHPISDDLHNEPEKTSTQQEPTEILKRICIKAFAGCVEVYEGDQKLKRLDELDNAQHRMSIISLLSDKYSRGITSITTKELINELTAMYPRMHKDLVRDRCYRLLYELEHNIKYDKYRHCDDLLIERVSRANYAILREANDREVTMVVD